MDVPNRRSLKVQETDLFAKTASSRDAAPEATGMHSRRVLAKGSVSCTKPPHVALGAAEVGTDILELAFDASCRHMPGWSLRSCGHVETT